MLQDEGFVRRMDLNLRTRYIGLKTEIYQIADYSYNIYCINYTGEFSELSNVFNNEIRYVGYDVKLITSKPDKYIKKINGISLDNVVENFKATCITMGDIDNFIKNRFCDINVINISTPQKGINYELLIEVSKDTDIEKMNLLRKHLIDSEIGTDKIIVKRVDAQRQEKEVVVPFDFNYLKTDTNLPFTVAETEFWYESAEDIYAGKIKREDIPFFRTNTTKCFLNFSIFNNINLRNVLLLYDTAYICIPPSDRMDSFLSNQGMTITDLLELINMGKLVVLLPQDESNYDKKIITQAYSNSPLNIIGRRGINILLATYLSETKVRYENRYPGIYNLASNIFMQGVRTQNILMRNIGKTIAWPITALAESFPALNHYSPIVMSDFGINNILEKNILKEKADAIQFEFTINSLNSHIASALQATYFPYQHQNNDGTIYSDKGVSKVWSDFLKLYQYNANTLQDIKTIQETSQAEYINLFECKENINITKVALLADKYKTPKGFANILNRLGNMSEEERKKQISEYNDIIFELSEEHHKGSAFKFMLGSSGFMPLPFWLSFALSSVGLIKDKIDETQFKKDYDEMKSIEKHLERSGIQYDSQKIEDIHLLDKMSSVAMLK